MAIVKNNKKGSNSGTNQLENIKEISDMEIDSLSPPAPDPDLMVSHQIQNQVNAAPPSNIEVVLNEQALEELIEKEEDNLAKNENSQMKSIDEIKTNLNSLNSFFQNNNNNLYNDNFYSNLKMQISK